MNLAKAATNPHPPISQNKLIRVAMIYFLVYLFALFLASDGDDGGSGMAAADDLME